jgi:hypothetical protein
MRRAGFEQAEPRSLLLAVSRIRHPSFGKDTYPSRADDALSGFAFSAPRWNAVSALVTVRRPPRPSTCQVCARCQRTIPSSGPRSRRDAVAGVTPEDRAGRVFRRPARRAYRIVRPNRRSQSFRLTLTPFVAVPRSGRRESSPAGRVAEVPPTHPPGAECFGSGPGAFDQRRADLPGCRASPGPVVPPYPGGRRLHLRRNRPPDAPSKAYRQGGR